MSSVVACFKCKKNTGSVPSRDGAAKLYCTDCFSEFCTKTFRDTLFGSCAFPSDEPIAVGVSGGPNSLFLLYQLGVLRCQGMLRGGEGRTSFLLLPFHLREDELVIPPMCPLIEEGVERTARNNAWRTWNGAARQERMASFTEVLERQFEVVQNEVERNVGAWEWANVRLFEPGALRIFRYSDFFTPEELIFLKSILHHPHVSLTCREELYTRIRHNILMSAAKRLCSEWAFQQEQDLRQSGRGATHQQASSSWMHFISGENAVRCCINALHSLVVGGGASRMLQQAGFRSFSHRVVGMRPLRMLLPKEIVLFNRLQGMGISYTPALSTGTSLPSFYRVLETFVYQTTVNHRTIIFNVLTIVSRLNADALFPVTASVLDSQKGIETMDKKRMVFSKAAYRHAFLQENPAPRISYSSSALLDTQDSNVVNAHAEIANKDSLLTSGPLCSMGAAPVSTVNHDDHQQEVLCFVCGVPFSISDGDNRNELRSPMVNDVTHSPSNMLCLSCRECINDTFAAKWELSADPFVSIWKRLTEEDASSSF